MHVVFQNDWRLQISYPTNILQLGLRVLGISLDIWQFSVHGVIIFAKHAHFTLCTWQPGIKKRAFYLQ